MFPGSHADFGGGFPTTNDESGLSDLALLWMVEQLKTVGVQFSQPIYRPFAPDPRGTAHQPWEDLAFRLGKQAVRQFQNTGILEHPSIQQRIDAGPVVPDPGEAPVHYARSIGLESLPSSVGRMPAGRSATIPTTKMAEPLPRSALRGLDCP